MNIRPKCFYLPTGSASTHAGFLLGLLARGCDIPVKGICVRRDASSQQQRLLDKIESIVELMGLDTKVNRQQVICDDRFLAPGYGLINPATQSAIETLARREGLLLDPTYSGKTFAALLEALHAGEYGADDDVVFLHTGGTPSLFAYPDLLDVADG